ncbi:hypothetical protein [Sphingobacterium faecium]|uniref:hypothetical protein n=1 Tax=Sphingobacterium faecium TaxID=34087 RepID=UPI003209E467
MKKQFLGMVAGSSKRYKLGNINQLLILYAVIFLFNSCSKKNYELYKVNAYCSYNNTILPPVIKVFNTISPYDSIIRSAMEQVGLPNSDIKIRITNQFNAGAEMNKKTNIRSFLYGVAFFDSVVVATGSNWGVMSICFHELAHILYQHPLRASPGDKIFEKQADWYSGFQMAVAGATIEQALNALSYVADEEARGKHPDKRTRLQEVVKGYSTARIRIFKDSTYVGYSLERPDIIHMDHLISEMRDSISVADSSVMRFDEVKIISGKKSPAERFSLYGEMIYISPKGEVKLLNSDQTIGKLLPFVKDSQVMMIENIEFRIEKSHIFSRYPDGSLVEVGYKISN